MNADHCFTHNIRGKCTLVCMNFVGFSPSPGEDWWVLFWGFFFPSISGQTKFCLKLPITQDFCKIWTLPSIDAVAGKLDEQLLPQLPCCCPPANAGSCQLSACWVLVVCDLSSAPASWLPSLSEESLVPLGQVFLCVLRGRMRKESGIENCLSF